MANELNEPVALPGGYIFVSSGLMRTAQDEAEFTGMLAHAMAHIAARHTTRMATREHLVSQAVPLTFIGGWPYRCTGIPITFLKLMREFELEADSVAGTVMARAGFDPAGLVRYIERQQSEVERMQAAFSPLPSRQTRVAQLEQSIQRLPAQDYVSGDGYQRVRDEVRSLTGKPAPPPPHLR